MIKRQQGEDIPFILNFQAGTNTEIIGFNSFSSITCDVWTANYPISIIALTVTPTQLQGNISELLTAQMFGQIWMLLTFQYGTLTFKKKIALEIYIDQAV